MRDPKDVGVLDTSTFSTVSLAPGVEQTFPANANRKQMILYIQLTGTKPVEFGYGTGRYAYRLSPGESRELDTNCELFLFCDLGTDILITEVI